MQTLQLFNDVIQFLPVSRVPAVQHKPCPSSEPPRKLVWRGSMTHTNYESHMTHLEDLVVFLFFKSAPKAPLNELTIQTLVGYLLTVCHSTLQRQPKKRPQMTGPREQSCIENLKVLWLFLFRLMSQFVILFNYRVFTFLIMSTTLM